MRFLVPNRRGFTLIEIVVAVGIIGILATVVLASMSSARAKARDTQRQSDLQQIKLALRLYKDAYGEYPAAGCDADEMNSSGQGGQWASPGSSNKTEIASCDDYISGLIPSYLPVLPTDPKSETDSNLGYSYTTGVNASGGSEYKFVILDTVEGGNVLSGEEFARCPASCGSDTDCTPQPSYAVYSSGAACW